MENITNFKQELGFRTTKILDIFYIALISLSISYFVTIKVDQLLPEFDPKEADKKNKWIIFAEIILHLGLMAVLFYIINNLVEMIPSPFEGVYGLEHMRVKEIRFSLSMTLMMFYQKNLRNKMSYFRERYDKDTGYTTTKSPSTSASSTSASTSV